MRDSSSGLQRAFFVGLLVAVVGLLGFGATAMAQAQQQEQPATQEQFKEEVVVTGTLIPRPTLEAMSPVTTMDVEELTYRGMTRLEDLLTSLPMVFNAQNSTISNGASGTATIDLRYLGAVRTLVLVDGKRLPSGDVFSPSPDLNFIPAALVKRVDILTGGASSTYGADAVAGVVNFVLDKDFEGVRATVNGGGYEHDNNNDWVQAMNARKNFNAPSGQAWDGGQFNADVALGGKFADGKGHAWGYLDYRKTAGLLKDRRDYLNCSVLGLTGGPPACGGSSTIPDGRFYVYDADYNSFGSYTLDRGGPGNTLRTYNSSTDPYNYAIWNYMQRPDTKYSGGGSVTYEFNKHVQAYVDVMMMDDHSDAQIAPSADFGNTALLNCDNPMLSAQEYQTLCVQAGYGPHDMANIVIGKRNVEGGPRDASLDHTSFRLVGGFKGEIDKVWSYDIYGLEAQTKQVQNYLNDMNVTRLQDALIVDGDPNDPSTWACRSGNTGCVPWNVFKLGGVTQAALDYLQLPLVEVGTTKGESVNGNFTANLREYGIALPSATEGLKLALGGDYRKEFLIINPDLAFQQGWGSGQGGPTLPVNGFYDVKEFFAELLVPLVQGAKGAKDLSLSLGYRYSDYNINGSHPTYKAEASYTPIDDLKFRIGFNRAVRAPNVGELFTPQGIALLGSIDPCAGSAPSATQAQCALTGVSAAQYGHVLENPAQQYNGIQGGNANLNPETADTKTFGLVITPTALAGFTATFDYYNIKIKDVIGALNPDDIIKQCLATGNPALCSLIHRDVAGTLWLLQGAAAGYTLANNQNVGELRAEGIDTNLTYVLPAGNSFFNFSLIGTYDMKSETNTGLYTYDCKGLYGNQCGDPTPTWRHLARFSWETGKLVLSMGWRYVGAVKVDVSSDQSALYDAGATADFAAAGSAQIPAYNYIDLAVSWNITKGIQWTFGVNNIADKEPPLGAGFSPNDYGPGFHGTYDPYGRFVHSAINFTF
jgi:iron complex outermembrane recepter protein